jgi:opacity protein-like surface antigen
MNKTSVLMSAAAIAICASSASFAMGLDNMYVGPQIAMSSASSSNTSEGSHLDTYGAVIGSQINDMFSADLNYLTEGSAYSIMVDGYFNRALSSKVTSRLGLGLGLAHENSQTTGDETTSTPTSNKLGYQAILEMDYSISDSLSLVTGYHYMTQQGAEDSEHANMFVIGAHYKLNATA